MKHKQTKQHRSRMKQVFVLLLSVLLVCNLLVPIDSMAASLDGVPESYIETETTMAQTEGETTEESPGLVIETASDQNVYVVDEDETIAETEIIGHIENSLSGMEIYAVDELDSGVTLSEEEEIASVELQTISGPTSVAAGSSITLSSNRTNTNYHYWYSTNESVATVSGSSSSATVTGVAAGTATIWHAIWQNNNWVYVDSYNITVTQSTSTSTKVTVAVYVAARHTDKVTDFSSDMLDLLNVSQINSYGYFTAGTLELDLSQLSSRNTSSMIQTDEDWDYVLGQLASLNTTASNDPGNNIAEYAKQVLRDKNASASGMFSGLWTSWDGGAGLTGATRVNANGYPDANGNYTWHLDLRFDTVQITYIYGNNKLGTDGTEAGKKVFIKGATMDYTPTINVPDGYKVVGYYKDFNCTDGQEWDAVNKPIDEDTTVYIKIVPQEDVVIHYVVAEGEGTVTDPSNGNKPVKHGMEHFNPITGFVVGSTATPATDWVFEGWYEDEACTKLISNNAHYIPQSPSDGWKEDTEYTYYAKFVQKYMPVTVEKEVTGNMGDKSKAFPFTLTDASGTPASFSLSNGNSETITGLIIGSTITLQESDNADYKVTVQYGSYDENGVFSGTTVSAVNGVYSIPLELGKNTILVTNNWDATPDTGLNTDSGPYVLILMLCSLALAGGFLIFCRRRRLQ